MVRGPLWAVPGPLGDLMYRLWRASGKYMGSERRPEIMVVTQSTVSIVT